MFKSKTSLSTISVADKVTKRQKLVAAALLFAILFLASLRYRLPVYIPTGLQVLLVVWALDFDLRPSEVVPFVIPPLLYTGVFYFWGLGFMGLSALLTGVMVAVFYYVLLLALNIINVATVRTVPLEKAALSTLYFLGMVMFFVLGVTGLRVGWGVGEYLGWFVGAATVFGLSYLYFSSQGYDWVEWLVFALLVLETTILVNFWPANQYVAVFSLVGWIFIFLGVLHHHVRKDLGRGLGREYAVVAIILLLAFLWG